ATTPLSRPSALRRQTDRIVSIDSCLACSMNPQVLMIATSASSGSRVSANPSSTAWPTITSESTRLRAQPRLIRQTLMASFIRARRPRSPVRAGSNRLGLHDPDLHLGVDLRVQVQPDVEHANLLGRRLEAHVVLLDREALGAQGGGDLRRGDRAEQVAILVGAPLDRDRGV